MSGENTTRPRILQIEDDVVDRRAVARVFGDHAELCQCPTMASAKRVLDQRWALVLLDLTLPDSTDPIREVLSLVRPGTAVIVTTGANQEVIEQVQREWTHRVVILSKEGLRALVQNSAAEMLTPLVRQIARQTGVAPVGDTL